MIQLTALGVRCEVVAPTLVPVKAGDRVKTDRRDTLKLARSYRAGDLTPVWVPDAAHEALRDVVRAREAAKKDQLRARHRLGKFLLRHGLTCRSSPAGRRSANAAPPASRQVTLAGVFRKTVALLLEASAVVVTSERHLQLHLAGGREFEQRGPHHVRDTAPPYL